MRNNVKFPSTRPSCFIEFRCPCCGYKFKTNSYEEYPINENDKCVGTTYITFCPECDNEVLEDEYSKTYYPKPYRYSYEINVIWTDKIYN